MSLIPSFFGSRRSNVLDPLSFFWDPFVGFPFSDLHSFFLLVANAGIHSKERPEAHMFKVDVHGLKKEEVKVEDDSVLKISGERIKEEEEKKKKKNNNNMWHRVGKSLNRFRLPEIAELEQVKFTMENGVLTVMVPKDHDVEDKKRT